MPTPLSNAARSPYTVALGPKPTWPQRQLLFDAIGYIPSPEQELFHRGIGHHGSEARCKLVTGGEQSGKSYSAAAELYSKAPWGRLFWIVAPDYAQGRHEMRYLRDFFGAVGALDTVSMPESPGPWQLTLKGGIRIRTISAQDVERIAGEAPDGILMVEAAQQPYSAYLRCLGRTGPAGGWLCINGTLEGSTSWFAELYRLWQLPNAEDGWAMKMPSWANRARYPGGREDPEIVRMERALPHEYFLERYCGEPVPPKGLVFREFSHNHHVRPIRLGEPARDPAAGDRTLWLPADTPLELWIDPGYAGGYAVLFVAVVADTVYQLGEVYTQYRLGEEVVQLVQTHPLWEHCNGQGWIDVAAKQHHSARSEIELWQARPPHGPGLQLNYRPVGIRDGILRVKSFLKVDPLTGSPRFFVDPSCEKTIWEATEGYRFPTDDAGEAVSELPIDRHNHAMKSWSYGVVGHFGLLGRDLNQTLLKKAEPSWVRLRRARGNTRYKRR